MSEKFARGSKDGRFLSEFDGKPASLDYLEVRGPEYLKNGVKKKPMVEEGTHPMHFEAGATPENVSRRIRGK